MRATTKVIELTRDEMRGVVGGGLGGTPLGFRVPKAIAPVGMVGPRMRIGEWVGESNPQPSP